MKLFTILSFAWLCFLAGETTYDLKEGGISIDLANDAWSLDTKQNQSGTIVYWFKRQPVEDSQGRQVIPNIAVLIEEVGDDVDVVTYTAMKRSRVAFDVQEVFTHEGGRMTFKNAIGYKGTYTDRGGLDHTVYIVHGLNEGKGLQVICDTTTDILDRLDDEFLLTLKSIRLSN